MHKNVPKSQMRKIRFQRFHFFPWKALVIQLWEVYYGEDTKRNYKSEIREVHFNLLLCFLEWSSHIPSIHLLLTFHLNSSNFRNPVQPKTANTDGSYICCRDLYTLKSEQPGLGICCEMWSRLKLRLGSGFAVAVAVAGRCSSDSTPSLGTSICCGCSP